MSVCNQRERKIFESIMGDVSEKLRISIKEEA
jgi:hypothetical protein